MWGGNGAGGGGGAQAGGEENHEETLTCPLCLEEMDETDRGLFPCECGYQVSSRGLYVSDKTVDKAV